MTEYWFDANFFIAARQENKLPLLKKLIQLARSKYELCITKRVRNEIYFFNNTISIFFRTIKVEKSSEFLTFCHNVRNALGNSKKQEEPADQSLAFAAAQSNSQAYIITNDEGFHRAKKFKRNFMANVIILEPTEFVASILSDFNDTIDDEFQKQLKNLMIVFAKHFIKYRLKDPNKQRPIENILESLLLYSATSMSASIERDLPERELTLIRRFISNEILEVQDEQEILPIQHFFQKFVDIYASQKSQERDFLTKVLYLNIPQTLSDLRDTCKKNEVGILKYGLGIHELIERELFKVRIEETIHYFRNCLFDDAFFHFGPLLETDWSFELKIQTIHDLKFLYGMFQLHFEDFAFLEHLIGIKFWDEFPEVKHIFLMLINIKNENLTKNINSFSVDDLTFLYKLGLYFSNTGNPFGLQIFTILFQLTTEKLLSLQWASEFMKRFILEIRLNEKELTEPMKEKLLSMLKPKHLENNTKKRFDRSHELIEPTPVEKANFLFQQHFYLMKYNAFENDYESFCWNDTIRSIVILKFPRSLCPNLKNVKSIQILGGDIKTKKIQMTDRKNARIIVELEENCILDIQRFQLKIMEESEIN